ncbi:ATP-dependent DNA ligase [Herbiconiux sp. VKM Ac-2851]|uniref:DUF7882 family protein n=1 Tax=Herbiconiux sp. VKM Ac-2851 TaxID=2739025 RepID=UPI0015656000|nr:ATP-dependent DNA ligase [Herbiconiux sp. VKM Ac-2851]
MGRLIHASETTITFEDRTLAHLQTVIGAKFRRGESFLFSWRDDAAAGGGRTTIWMHPHHSVVFDFSGSRPPSLNRAWVEALMRTANSPSGLQVLPEPAADPAP